MQWVEQDANSPKRPWVFEGFSGWLQDFSTFQKILVDKFICAIHNTTHASR
jgi:hypothetical protein